MMTNILPEPNMSIVIPCFTSDKFNLMDGNKINEEELYLHIQDVFHNSSLALVERVDFRLYNGTSIRAFVHFQYWYNNNYAREFQEHILSQEKSCLWYSNDSYWIINKCDNPRTKEEALFEQTVCEMEYDILENENKMLHRQLEQSDAIINELLRMISDSNKFMVNDIELSERQRFIFDPLCDQNLETINTQEDLPLSLKERK